MYPEREGREEVGRKGGRVRGRRRERGEREEREEREKRGERKGEKKERERQKKEKEAREVRKTGWWRRERENRGRVIRRVENNIGGKDNLMLPSVLTVKRLLHGVTIVSQGEMSIALCSMLLNKQ